jgi:hypothetical protein
VKTPEEMLEEHKDLIQRASIHIARRTGVLEHRVESFSHFIAGELRTNDYTYIRAYRGTASERTYLVVVLYNIARRSSCLLGRERFS